MYMIFYYPLPLNKNAKSASGIRPVRILSAFKSLGYKVDLVTGYSLERKNCIHEIKKNIKAGVKYDFIYAETSTIPTVLTDPHHFPMRPLMDWLFFEYCKTKHIPIGLFYRDIYWLFDNYGEKELNPITRFAARLAFKYELWVYNRTLSVMFLPSAEMGRYIPRVNQVIFESLPPGHLDKSSSYISCENKKTIKLFYVGGMTSHYQLHQLFDVVSEFSNIELTICTRKDEWDSVKREYKTSTSNIKVIHAVGLEMESHLRDSDIAVLYVKPYEYWEFASPFKLYEYMGFGKPILASENTLAGRFVRENDIGWSIPYDRKSLKKLLIQLLERPLLIDEKYENIKKVAKEHTWKRRAKKVVDCLVNKPS